MITEALVKKASGEYDCEVVLRLNVEGLGLLSIGNLGSCIILRDLFLGKNEISDISPLTALSNSLERLDLSFNKVSSLDPLESLCKLIWLDVKGNQLSTFDSISAISSLQTLQTLHLQTIDGNHQNGVCKLTSYAARMMQLNPNLVILDGHHVDLLGAAGAVEEAIANIKPDATASAEIPSVPWFTSDEVDISENDSFPTVDESITKLGSALTTDSNELLRRAQKTLQKLKETTKI